jgi:hypothetical protein
MTTREVAVGASPLRWLWVGTALGTTRCGST